MGVHSGKFGYVNTAFNPKRVINWSIDETNDAQRHVTSATKTGSGRKRGLKDWSGSFSALNGLPLVMPGNPMAFEGYTAPGSDVIGGVGVVWYGDAIVDQVVITWDWTAGLLITAEYSFSGDGPLAQKSAYYDDSSIECPLSTLDGKIEVGVDVPGLAEVSDVANFSLTYLAENAAYANSGTAGWMMRKSGPLDWTASMEVHNEDRSTGMVIGGDYLIRAHIDGSGNQFHHLEWGHVADFTGLAVNTDSGDIISHTANWGMNVCNDDVLGKVLLPGETLPTWFPPQPAA